MDNSEVILEAKKVADIKGIFVVPYYQRGYRWGEQQVKTLLSDIWGAFVSICLITDKTGLFKRKTALPI